MKTLSTPGHVLFQLQKCERSQTALLLVVKDWFPIGCKVRYQGIVGTVVGNVTCHGCLPVRFENGNVWDKPIRELTKMEVKELEHE